MNVQIFTRLLWKDYRLLRSLAIAAPLSTLGFFILLELISHLVPLGRSDTLGGATAIWSFVPFLVAFGAPALLIGSEEDSGSLAWLRTLPANWKPIIASKFLVSFGCLMWSWLIGTLLLFVTFGIHQKEILFDITNSKQQVDGPFPAALGTIGLSIAALLCSLFTATYFRSAIVGLIASAPMFGAALWAFFGLFVWWSGAARPMPFSADALFWFVAIACLVLLALTGLTTLASRQRLTGPERDWSALSKANRIRSAYQPPMSTGYKLGAALAGRRPSPFHALLWQSFRPNAWYYLLAVVISIAAGVLVHADQNSRALGYILLAIVGFAIAGLTFYSDSIRGRSAFFFDRGISPRLVWVTRLLPSFVLIHLILLIAISPFLITVNLAQETAMILSIYAGGLAAYAMAVLFSQATTRPLLSFFAGPVAVHFSGMFLVLAVFGFYPWAVGVLLISAAILFVASYRLTNLWTQRKAYTKHYVLTSVKYIAAALLFPVLVVLAIRWSTMLPNTSTWRQDMFAMELPTSDRDPIAIRPGAGNQRLRLSTPVTIPLGDELDWILSKELADEDNIGEHISLLRLSEIFIDPQHSSYQGQQFWISRIGHPDTTLFDDQLAVIDVLQKWSRVVRDQAIEGQSSFNELLYVAEHADWLSTLALQMMVNQSGVNVEIRQRLVNLPSDQTVQQSRQNSLIRHWRSYQESRSGFWGGYPNPPTLPWLVIERVRAQRAVDHLTMGTLEQTRQGDWFTFAETAVGYETIAYIRRDTDVNNVYAYYPLYPSEWIRRFGEIDQRLKTLRGFAGSKSGE
ncbi:ABC-2 transporter permease [Roseiconus lacunae]|uniref:ABC-2 transporter permease n=1 Tax=Roseiconus lacunae TaxID=2605694 RepID=UPI0011F3DBCF|nr:ABC-2 transporter permease [Roseiconus lacunae]